MVPVRTRQSLNDFVNVTLPGSVRLVSAVRRLPRSDYEIDLEHWAEANQPFVRFSAEFFTAASIQRICALALRALGRAWHYRNDDLAIALTRLTAEELAVEKMDWVLRLIDPTRPLLNETAKWAQRRTPPPNLFLHLADLVKSGDVRQYELRQIEYVYSLQFPSDKDLLAQWITGRAAKPAFA